MQSSSVEVPVERTALTSVRPGQIPRVIEAFPANRVRRWLGVILLLTAALDLFCFTGFYASDDRKYFSAAAMLAETWRLPEEPPFGATRLTLLTWNLAFGLLSRFNMQLVCASYVGVHLILVLLTYALAKKAHGVLAGLIAAWTSGMFPLYVVFSTSIFPDLLIAVGFVLSLLAYMKAYERRERGEVALPMLWMSLCGAAVGVAYMAKENGLVALPFYFMAWIGGEWKARRAVNDGETSVLSPGVSAPSDGPVSQVQRRPALHGRGAWWIRAMLTGAAFPIGFFAMFGLEYRLLIRITHNPSYFRMGWTDNVENLDAVRNFHLDGGFNPWERLKQSNQRLSGNYLPPFLKGALLAGILLFPFVHRRWRVILFFGLWFYAFSTWGTYSFKHYYPPRLQPRYYIPMFPFIIAAFSISLAWLIERWLYAERASRGVNVARGLVFAGITLSPLLYLHGPDRLAGTLYRAYYVHHLHEFLSFTTKQKSPLVVLSGHVAYRIMPLWYRGLPRNDYGRRPRGLIGATEMSTIHWNRIARRGFFHYVDLKRNFLPRPVQVPIIDADALIHPAMNGDLVVRQPQRRSRRPLPVPLGEAEFFAPLEAGETGIVQFREFIMQPALQAGHRKDYVSRSKEVLHRFFASLDFKRRYFRTASAMHLIRVDVERGTLQEVARVSLLEDATREDLRGSPLLVHEESGWRVADAARASLTMLEGGGIQVSPRDGAASAPTTRPTDEPANAGVRLELATPDGSAAPITLSPHTYYRLSIDGAWDGVNAVEIVLSARPVSGSDEGSEVVKRAPLVSGQNRVSFYTGERAVRLAPAIEFQGEGPVLLRDANILALKR
ncbi:MAG TPA: hypothetical protein VNT79_04380 [Phycisphaerae bacterium]|nr:hypothetical protein [Phycisphaerae bacterium]